MPELPDSRVSKPWYKNVDPELRRGKWVFEESKVVRVHKTEHQSRKAALRQNRKPAEGVSQHTPRKPVQAQAGRSCIRKLEKTAENSI